MPSNRTIVLAIVLVVAQVTGSPLAAQRAQRDAPVRGYEVVHSYPHDPDAFTQGLVYRNGVFYESTGRNGHSTVRRVEPQTGRVLEQRSVAGEYFAEGLTDWRDRLIQLTWTSKIGFVYDLATLRLQTTFAYTGEGWGLTHDDRRLIMSDGSAALRFLDPETFKELGRVTVTDAGRPVERLNELEFVNGRVYANVWLTERIAVVDPGSGRVESWIDLSGLRGTTASPTDDVLNGIAYDAATGRIYITGKLWPDIYEIKFGL